MPQHAPSETGHPSSGRRAAVLRAVGLVAVVLGWLAIAGLGGPAIGSLSSVQSNSQETFLPAGAESVAATEAARAFDNSGQLPAFVVFTTGDGSSATPSSWPPGAATPSRWPGSRSSATRAATWARSVTTWSTGSRSR